MWDPQKSEKTELPCDPAMPQLSTGLEEIVTPWKRYLHPQKCGTYMGLKWNTAHLEKVGSPAIGKNTNEPCGHYDKCDKSEKGRYFMLSLIYEI